MVAPYNIAFDPDKLKDPFQQKYKMPPKATFAGAPPAGVQAAAIKTPTGVAQQQFTGARAALNKPGILNKPITMPGGGGLASKAAGAALRGAGGLARISAAAAPAVGTVQSAAEAVADPEGRQEFYESMGVGELGDWTDWGKRRLADLARTAQNVGNAATFGVADKVGNWLSRQINDLGPEPETSAAPSRPQVAPVTEEAPLQKQQSGRNEYRTGAPPGWEKIRGGEGNITTAIGPRGSSMSGIDRPGGSLTVLAGPTDEEIPGYSQMTNDQKIAAKSDLYRQRGEDYARLNAVRRAKQWQSLPEGQRGRMPDDIADVLGVARETRPKVQMVGGGVAGEGGVRGAIQDYLQGNVGSTGYRDIRNARMNMEAARDAQLRANKRAIQSMPGGRYKKMALRDLATQKADTGFADFLRQGLEGGGTAQPKMSDLLGIARLQGDQDWRGVQQDRWARQEEADAEERQYQRGMDEREFIASERARGLDELQYMVEQGGMEPDLAMAVRPMVQDGEPPAAIQQTISAILEQDSGLRGDFESNDPDARKAAVARVARMLQERRQ